MAIKKNEGPIQINMLNTSVATFNVIGKTPLIYHAMSLKAKTSLLNGSGKKTTAEKATSIKHDPLREYQDSFYKTNQNKNPTRLVFPATAFKQAICEVAKRIPGSSKAAISQLTWVNDWNANIYGIPQLHMSVVRSADMNRTPDIRTRGILPLWACSFTINYVSDSLSVTSLGNLLSAAGLLMGIGDWRPEKGAGNFGQFMLVNANDKAFLSIIKNGGIKLQDEAISNPETYDDQTDELLQIHEQFMLSKRNGQNKEDIEEVEEVEGVAL